MTDKEKRELKDGVISIFKRFNILDHTATIGGLRDDILIYIDSLQEEHVSKDKCNGCNNVKGCITCVDGSEWAHYEEPVSDELEDFALQYAGHHAPYDSCMQEVEDAVKAGDKWQKEK